MRWDESTNVFKNVFPYQTISGSKYVVLFGWHDFFRARVCVWVVVSVTCPCIHPFLCPRHSISHLREDELRSFSSFKSIQIFYFDCSNLEIEVRINMIPKNVLWVQTFFFKKMKTNESSLIAFKFFFKSVKITRFMSNYRIKKRNKSRIIFN